MNPLLSSSSLPITSYFPSLPGHLNNQDIWVIKFGQTKTYFYMTPEKHEIGQQLIKQINARQIKLVPDTYFNPRTTEMSAIASILPEGGEGSQLSSEIQDPTGQKVLNEYAQKAKEIVEKIFNIHLMGVTREINFIVSHDAHSFHRDSFPRQFKYIQEHFHPEQHYALVHDLALIDWDMADFTISGTLFHDPIGHDRFLISLLPKDEVNMFSVEPITYQESNCPTDPGAALLPYHTVLSPEDVNGTEQAGSSKGQRISMVLRGLIDKKEEDNLDQQAKELSLMRPDLKEEDIAYSNGIKLKPLGEKSLPDFPLKNINVWPERQNVEIFEIPFHDSLTIFASHLQQKFKMSSDYNAIHYFRVTKRDGGFTLLKDLDIPIPANSIIFLINRSLLPKGYKHYQIVEDQSDLGLPWIQFYQFNPHLVMQITPDLYKRLSLAPLIELIYRDEMQCQGERKPCKKFSTKIDILVLSQGK